MTAQAKPRGQPVLVLALVLGGWVALRVALWETPFARAVMRLPETLLVSAAPAEKIVPLIADIAPVLGRLSGQQSDAPPTAVDTPLPLTIDPAAPPAIIDLPDPLRPQLVPFAPDGPVPAKPLPQRLAAAHSMLYMAGLSGVSLPPELAGLLENRDRPASSPYQPLKTSIASLTGGRWSADGWLLLRQDTTSALTSGRGSYGRSQAGAVLRYALAPSSPYRPMAYARVSQAIGARESELALGLSARPLPKVPVRAAAELRLTQANGQTLVRPAAYAVTELPPFELPLDLTAEAYGQAGYVGGKYASAFADGQVRAERPLAEFGDAKLAAGAGAWGGAQKGAARLDIGPSASLQLKLGQTNSRVSMDWRFRVAGDAEPASGPALTISAGF